MNTILLASCNGPAVDDDVRGALQRLASQRLRAPREASGYAFAAELLQGSGRLADAESLLAAGMRRRQAANDLAAAYARAAMLRQDWSIAGQRWEHARALRPDDVAAHVGGIVADLKGGNHDGAAELLRRALRHAPAAAADIRQSVEADLSADERATWRAVADQALSPTPRTSAPPHQTVLLRQGFNAARQRNWTDAAAAWAELRRYHPSHSAGWVHGAWANIYLGETAAGETLLRQGLQTLPGHPELLIALAYYAAHNADWNQAVIRWEAARTAAPTAPDGWVHGATALLRTGNPSAAEVLMQQGLTLLPANLSLLTRHAYLAAERQDWPAALTRWQTVATTNPDNPEATNGLHLARSNLAAA